MKAIILAAGRGSRLGGLTDQHPKCMVELGGRPLLDWQIAALTAAGVEAIGVVRGWRGEVFNGRAETLFENPRWAETNMVMSLAAAADWLRAGPVLVSYSDIFYPPSAPTLLAAAAGDIAITYDPDWLALWSRRADDPLLDAETFQIAADGRITDIGRKPRGLEEVAGQYMGLLRFTPQGWAVVEAHLAGLEPAARDRLDMTSLLRGLIDGGTPVIGRPWRGFWGEVDTPADLALYHALLAARAVSVLGFGILDADASVAGRGPQGPLVQRGGVS